MMQYPQAVFESWPTPNYVDPVTRGPANTIIQLILFPLVVSILALRTYTRVWLSKSFGADDILILCALLPTTTFMLLSLLSELRWGLNRHIWDVPLDKVILGLKLTMTSNILFDMATTLTKLSMLVMIRRIMSVSNKRMHKAVTAAMWFIAGNGIILFIVVLFQCRPPSDYWTISFQPQPNCINQTIHVLIAGIINTMTDFLVVLIPIPTVYSLNLRSRQKYVTVVLFGLGFLVGFAGIARTAYTYKFMASYDPTWNSFPVWISSMIEIYVGIICASIPPTRLFFLHYVPGILNATHLSWDNNPGTFLEDATMTSSHAPNKSTPTLQDLGVNRFVDAQDTPRMNTADSQSALVSSCDKSLPSTPYPASKKSFF